MGSLYSTMGYGSSADSSTHLGSRGALKKCDSLPGAQDDAITLESAWSSALVKPFTYQFSLFTGNVDGAGVNLGTTINYTIIGRNDVYHGKIECTLFQWITKGSVRRVKVETHKDLGEIGSIILWADLEKTFLQRIIKKLVGLINILEDVTGTVLKPIATTLGVDQAWNLSYLSLSNATTSMIFPYYGWFDHKVNSTVLFNSAYIPQNTPMWLQHSRRTCRDNIKKYVKLQIKYGDNVPRACKTPLPITEHFNDGKGVDFTTEGLRVVDETLKSFRIKCKANKFSSFPSVESISGLYKAFEHAPSYSLEGRWKSDVWWGAAWLTGPFFGYFKPAAECMDVLGAISKAVGKDHEYMHGSSFVDELVAGRLFVAEFSVFKGTGVVDRPEYMKLLEGRYLCPDAVCLFRACSEKEAFEFLPVAIQLEKDGPVFLPSGDKWQWRTVKAHVMCNAANIHQIGLHWSECHAAAEPLCAAVLTQLTKIHPLRQLMMPHIAYTLAINGFAWKTLIAPPGDSPASIIQDTFALGPHSICLDEHTAEAWSKKVGSEIKPDGKGFAPKWWSTWKGYTHPRDYKTRWGSTDQLKVFPPRDDGIAVGEVIEAFISDFIDLYYEDDEACQGDDELEGFIKTTVTGLGKAPQEVLERYWRAAENKQSLKDLLTAFIFQVSCVHAARNFCQFDVYGAPHFAPTNMRIPPPTAVGRSSEEEFLDAIPNITNGASTMGVVSILSQYSGDDVYLARSDYKWITDPEAIKLQTVYYGKLRALVTAMEERNGDLERKGADHLSYSLLNPLRVPTSVAI